MAEFAGVPDGRGRRLAVLVSRFNEGITQRLEQGAVNALLRAGVAETDLDVIRVPGAWELAIAARTALATDRYDALVAIGAVIRGETPHFDYVADAAARGLAEAAAEFDTPIGFGVLTCDTMAQAEARAGGSHGNKGADAALAALEMADLHTRLDVAHDAGDEGDEDDAEREPPSDARRQPSNPPPNAANVPPRR
jgi:6,7-dimethyl-8-ribityllumazine synthase